MKPFRSVVRWLADWIEAQPWSARVMTVVGLLLGLMSAFEQYGLSWEWYKGLDEWIALILGLLLLVSSAWFAADVRRIRQWSKTTSDLRARVMDLEALHPDAIVATLQSVHDQDEAVARSDTLRAAVAEVNAALADRRPPSPDQVAHVESAAAAALAPTIDERRPADLLVESPEVANTWQSIARVRASARQASKEFETASARPHLRRSASYDTDRDHQSRLTELVTTATLLIGFIAAPNVVDAVSTSVDQDASTSVDENDPSPNNENLVDELENLNQTVADLEAFVATVEGSVRSVEDLHTRLSNMEEAGSGLSQINTALADIRSVLQPEPDVVVNTPVTAGTSIWNLVKDACENDGTARQIAADVISTWAANVEKLGSDPNQLEPGTTVTISCADEE
ncbi:MAG: hypothetical protein OER95_13595, partial [Acidimicrobiia bacterium]|nr:hypothetical protein [Acidimicrobiia bacterium]